MSNHASGRSAPRLRGREHLFEANGAGSEVAHGQHASNRHTICTPLRHGAKRQSKVLREARQASGLSVEPIWEGHADTLAHAKSARKCRDASGD